MLISSSVKPARLFKSPGETTKNVIERNDGEPSQRKEGTRGTIIEALRCRGGGGNMVREGLSSALEVSQPATSNSYFKASMESMPRKVRSILVGMDWYQTILYVLWIGFRWSIQRYHIRIRNIRSHVASAGHSTFLRIQMILRVRLAIKICKMHLARIELKIWGRRLSFEH